MQYLLDTDTYIFLTDGSSPLYKKILNKTFEVGAENIFFSSISVAELYYGAFKSNYKKSNLKLIQKHLEKLQILNFNRHSAKIFGRLKAQLKQEHRTIADMDLAIASIAIQHGSILVTHNTRHFSKIDELILEDWRPS